jgi:hypothetical protein
MPISGLIFMIQMIRIRILKTCSKKLEIKPLGQEKQE